ncbi:MAG: pyrroloquinoline quinone biosynthesis peptide chaperone PqqD [Betaproteobacteria bacterium]|jgi:pyrroloquinoline quinone biosynthesis protein D|nr:MAG: pyrroloquinoline quinone biosynthesis peptide chaperone PqqD [Betaproteobacteria bacterium]
MSESSGSKISEDAAVALEKQFRFQFEPAQDSYVLLYPEGLIKLEGSAGEIIKRIDGEKTVSQIVADLEATFPGVDLRQDVIDFLEHAYAKGWIRQ